MDPVGVWIGQEGNPRDGIFVFLDLVGDMPVGHHCKQLLPLQIIFGYVIPVVKPKKFNKGCNLTVIESVYLPKRI